MSTLWHHPCDCLTITALWRQGTRAGRLKGLSGLRAPYKGSALHMTLYSMTFDHSMTVSFVLYVFEHQLKAFSSSFEEMDLVMERWEWHRMAIYTLISTIFPSFGSSIVSLMLVKKKKGAKHRTVQEVDGVVGSALNSLLSTSTDGQIFISKEHFLLIFSLVHGWKRSAGLRMCLPPGYHAKYKQSTPLTPLEKKALLDLAI